MRRSSWPIFALLGACLLISQFVAAEDKAAAIELLLKRHHEVGAFNGAALVAENGKVIFKKGFGLADFEWKVPNAPDTKFRLGSITKQFTATLILQLVEEGKLSLDTTLAKALPYYRQDTGARVTIHHLLSHTSGIPSYTGLPNFFKDVSRNPYEVKDFVLKYCSGDLEFDPGTTFRYNNSGYFLLGAIVEQLTGKAYAQVLKERISTPSACTAPATTSPPLLEKRAHAYERVSAAACATPPTSTCRYPTRPGPCIRRSRTSICGTRPSTATSCCPGPRASACSRPTSRATGTAGAIRKPPDRPGQGGAADHRPRRRHQRLQHADHRASRRIVTSSCS